uniref:Uncharacterized protein n=1 Tax=Arundo donax TaxID=35708 RepID=A0A0A9FE14_ARUDO
MRISATVQVQVALRYVIALHKPISYSCGFNRAQPRVPLCKYK